MRIGLISVNDKATTKMACGGTEVFVSDLAEELAGRGHEVTIFAGGGSYVKGCRIVTSTDHSLADIQAIAGKEFQIELNANERAAVGQILAVRNIMAAKRYEKEIDVFHENSGSSVAASMLDLFEKPVVSTLHMPISLDYQLPCINRYLSHPNVHYVAISDYQREQFPLAKQRIYNGTRIMTASTGGQRQNLIWIGRIDPDTPKGLEDAVRVSEMTGHDLEYVGFVENESYFQDTVVPVLHDRVKRRNPFQTREDKYAFYHGAKVSLIPVKCEESFGLTYIESMMAGTPVITYARGAAPEIVKDGETGFLVNWTKEEARGDYCVKQCGIAGLVEAVKRIYAMPPEKYAEMRRACRRHAEENFSLSSMADQYESLYRSILRITMM